MTGDAAASSRISGRMRCRRFIVASVFGIAVKCRNWKNKARKSCIKGAQAWKFRRSGCLKNDGYCLKIVHTSFKHCFIADKRSPRRSDAPDAIFRRGRAIIRKIKDKFVVNDGGPPMKRIPPGHIFRASCTEVLFGCKRYGFTAVPVTASRLRTTTSRQRWRVIRWSSLWLASRGELARFGRSSVSSAGRDARYGA